jgi:glutaredoxin
MRNKFLNILSTYTSWIMANYQAISRANSTIPILRLISQEQDKKTGEDYFLIQVVGKNIFPKLFLKDITDISILTNFNNIDQKALAKYISRHKNSITKRIIARTFDRGNKLFIFTVESCDHQKQIKKCITTNSLSLFSNDLESFDNEDSFLIKLESNKELN